MFDMIKVALDCVGVSCVGDDALHRIAKFENW